MNRKNCLVIFEIIYYDYFIFYAVEELELIRITVHEIKKIEDYNDLINHVHTSLINQDIIDSLKIFIGTKCDTIKIEYPYFDSDYLSTYYEHYSQKFKGYQKECCRLHFEKNEEYYGYITLRPTINDTKFGKTYLSPKMFLEKNAFLMLSKYKVHIFGQAFEIECFPWKRQQTDISICAHTAAWTIIRYFGNKYKNYADTTIGKIVEKTKNDWGRKTPSLGLNPIQVSDLFKEYGFSPLIIDSEKRVDFSFWDEIMAYIESGLPMVGFLSVPEHAISIIGHGEINYDILDDKQLIEQIMDKETGIIPHSRLIQSLYVMDDRLFPYIEMPMGLPTKEHNVEYGFNQLNYAVVPLYSRMQLVYRDVYTRFVTWIKEKNMQWEEEKICRIYITSTTSLKREAFRSLNMPQELKDIILTLSLPRFVWCIDIAGMENYKKQLTSGRIIIDTTSATWDSEPWILRHDSTKIQYRDFDSNPDIILEVKAEIEPYSLYRNNLESIDWEDD